MNFVNIISAIGFILFGFWFCLESAQAYSDEFFNNLMNKWALKKRGGLFTGIGISTLTFSSSITTKMVIGLVNAGLISFEVSFFIVLGSQIGAALSLWPILFFLKFPSSILIAVSLLVALIGQRIRSQIFYKIFLGAGLVFLGLEFLNPQVFQLSTDQIFLNSVSLLFEATLIGFLYSVLFSMVVSSIFGSTFVTLTILSIFYVHRIIPTHSMLLMIMGANLGPSIWTWFDSVAGNISSKRISVLHILFKTLGIVILIPIIYFFHDKINFPNTVYTIFLFNLFFNVVIGLFFISFQKPFLKLFDFIFGSWDEKTEEHHLVFMGKSLDLLPSTTIIMAEIEIRKFKQILSKMHGLTRKFIADESVETNAYSKIKEYENITDNIQKEMTLFLCKIMEKSLTQKQSRQTHSLLKIADELENIADYLERLAFYKTRFGENFKFLEETNIEFFEFYDQMIKLFEDTMLGLEGNIIDLNLIQQKAEQLKIMADDMRDKHIRRVTKGHLDPLTSLTYSDMVVSVRKIRLSAVHLARAIIDFKSE